MENCSLTEQSKQHLAGFHTTAAQHPCTEDSWKTNLEHFHTGCASQKRVLYPALCSGASPVSSQLQGSQPLSPLLQGLRIPRTRSHPIPRGDNPSPTPFATSQVPPATQRVPREPRCSRFTLHLRSTALQPASLSMLHPPTTAPGTLRVLPHPGGRCPRPSEPCPPAARTAHPGPGGTFAAAPPPDRVGAEDAAEGGADPSQAGQVGTGQGSEDLHQELRGQLQ